MFEADKKELLEGVKNLQKPSILVIGDMAIDEMVYGNTDRMSREAPVLILRHYDTKIILGAASNAAHNAASLNGGRVSVLGVCGDDYYSSILLETFKRAGINTEYMVKDKERATTVKTRISGSCSQSVTQQIVRIDRETTAPLSKETEDKILAAIESAVPKHDGILLSDYNIGVLTDKVIKRAIELAKKYNKIITVDAQKDLDRFQSVSSMTPNQPDSENFSGVKIKDIETLKKAGNIILSKTNADSILITLGGEGMALFEKNGSFTKIPVFNKKDVFDVTGAGDTAAAVFTLALSAGISRKNAALLSNIASSIVIRYFGCAVTKPDDLASAVNQMEFEKIKETL